MIFELILVLVLVIGNGVFAGAEIAIVSVRKTRMVELAEQGSTRARAVLTLKEQSERFLATVQVGITLVGATAAAFGGASIARELAPMLAELPWIGARADAVALSGVVAAVSFLSIVVGELVPKSLALGAAERYALLIAPPLLTLSWLARPVVWFLTSSANLVLLPFGDRTNFTEARYSAEELQELVRQATTSEGIHAHVGELVDRALELADMTAADLMIPRQEVVMLAVDIAEPELRAVLEKFRYSRFPVHTGSPDQVVGYVAVKDLLAQLLRGDKLDLRPLVREPRFVPESQRAIRLLETMRKDRPLAVVVDETGGTSGIVTLEDVIEAFVGDIDSEHSDNGPEEIVWEGPLVARVLASTPIRTINRQLHIELPEDDSFSTVAGYCLSLARRIPRIGEKFMSPEHIEFEVLDATPRRIRELRLRLPEPPPSPPESRRPSERSS